ncbi:MAG: endonuclease/exonuclease/phosphatase family protein [Opitutaceae bacterium]|nr:endonuclease/exonuclease/phosphatase family protein [Opitutaceae bacterium]
MTWNVENYVAEDRLVEGEYRTAYPKPEKAKAGLRAAIREARPEVLALQEMGPAPYLEELQRDLAAEGLAYEQRAWLDGPDPERHLAVLARVPLVRVVEHAQVPTRRHGLVRRGVLEVSVALGAREVTLFVVHLKSRHTDAPADPFAAAQRAGEAEAVRDLVLRRFPEPARAAFLLLGDCNDSPQSRPVRALARRGETLIASVLRPTDADGDSWTHYYRQEEVFSRVDYMLVSPGLRPAVDKAWIHDSPAVRVASDHRPVLVRLKVIGGPRRAGEGE